MYTKDEKIELVKYLESVTIGSTESKGLEYLRESQLDDLIRLCKINPANDAQMMNVKNAMDRRNEYRAAMREERLQKLRGALRCSQRELQPSPFGRSAVIHRIR